MTRDTRTAYERFLPWRRPFEIGVCVANAVVGASFNSITMVMDAHRDGLNLADWEPAVWEWSSALAWLALVWPVAWFSRRFPFHWDTWTRQWPWHLLASVVVSGVHVLAMVGMRTLAYRWQGGHYDFGYWPVEWGYEYLKDVRTYASMVLVIEFYRLLLRRMQGEAMVLGRPDDGPPVEPVERPSRFLVRKLGREFLIAAEEIEWAQAAGNYVNLRVRGHDYPLRSTMATLQAQLDPERFARIHRSYLVNLERVESIEPLESGDARIHLRDGQTLPCSRNHRGALRSSA